MTTAATNLPTRLTAPELWNIRLQEIKRLITEETTGVTVDLYHRPIALGGPSPSKLPAIHIQPESLSEPKNTTVKYDLVGQLTLMCFEGGNDWTKTGEACMRLVSVLSRLFSDNALGDRLTGSDSKKAYIYHPPFWIDATFGPVRGPWVAAYGKDQSRRLGARAFVGLTIHDVIASH